MRHYIVPIILAALTLITFGIHLLIPDTQWGAISGGLFVYTCLASIASFMWRLNWNSDIYTQ